MPSLHEKILNEGMNGMSNLKDLLGTSVGAGLVIH
jgi:hypothetical protein